MQAERGWILVTGGSRGIGRGLVEHLTARGRDVVFTYKASADAARALAEQCSKGPGRCEAIACDGADPGRVHEVVGELVTRKGAPYALINNMGITADAALVNTDVDQWDGVIRTNLGSAFLFARATARAMMGNRDGVILQMTSVSGLQGLAGQTAYSASKAGLIGFTRSLALEMARFGVRVNAVAPGFIETEMTHAMPELKRDALVKRVPLRRAGTVDDVAGLVEFLLGPAATYITGQTLVVDGGLTA